MRALPRACATTLPHSRTPRLPCPRARAHAGEDPVVCKAHAQWGEQFQRLHPQLPPAPAPRDLDPERTLVVGYVSPDLFTHSVSYFAEAPLSHHRTGSHVRHVVYCCTPKYDAKTLRLRGLVEAAGGLWRDAAAMSEAQLAEQVWNGRVLRVWGGRLGRMFLVRAGRRCKGRILLARVGAVWGAHAFGECGAVLGGACFWRVWTRFRGRILLARVRAAVLGAYVFGACGARCSGRMFLACVGAAVLGAHAFGACEGGAHGCARVRARGRGAW
eukprot:25540-Chlamydomonas_euryale.AAC.1